MDNTDLVDNPPLRYRLVHRVWTTKTCCSHSPQHGIWCSIEILILFLQTTHLRVLFSE